MYMQSQSKGPELIGNPCLETGVKIGKATLTSMAKPYLLRLPPVTAAPSLLLTWLLLTGPLVRLTQVANFKQTPLSVTIILE